jgi:hypothetical protein
LICISSFSIINIVKLIITKTLIYAVHGLLALYLSGNGLTEETLFADLDRIIDFVLRR